METVLADLEVNTPILFLGRDAVSKLVSPVSLHSVGVPHYGSQLK